MSYIDAIFKVRLI